MTAKKPMDKSSQAAAELHFEDHFLTDSLGLWTLPMPVETKAEEKNMIQSPVVTCLPAYVALRCPFYLLPMGALRCKALEKNREKK